MLVAVALVVWVIVDSIEPDKPNNKPNYKSNYKPEPARPPTSVPRDQVFAMHRTARIAATKGDCETVMKLNEKVRAMDREYHESMFVEDPAIRRCLTNDPVPAPGNPPPDAAVDTSAGSQSP